MVAVAVAVAVAVGGGVCACSAASCSSTSVRSSCVARATLSRSSSPTCREVWGGVGRYGEIWGDMGRYGVADLSGELREL